MDTNPWLVDSIQAFSFLKCPECVFDTKDRDFFQDHAVLNHPMSYVLFGKKEDFEDFLSNEENLHQNSNLNGVTTIDTENLVTLQMNQDLHGTSGKI